MCSVDRKTSLDVLVKIVDAGKAYIKKNPGEYDVDYG